MKSLQTIGARTMGSGIAQVCALTSSISIAKLVAATDREPRFVGMHITRVLQNRVQTATERFRERVQKTEQGMQLAAAAWPASPQYAIDCAQRAKNCLEHVQQGQPPVLRFKYEMVLGCRSTAGVWRGLPRGAQTDSRTALGK